MASEGFTTRAQDSARCRMEAGAKGDPRPSLDKPLSTKRVDAEVPPSADWTPVPLPVGEG